MTDTRRDWWRDAVIYQVYIRSFADGDGDGLGDVEGIRSRLPYLRDLGVDAIWINPWYPSPMADAGYDVADYRDVEPVFGTLEQAERLLREAHELGLKVFLDIVPNHTSDEHPWFQEALSAGPGSDARGRYHFRAGRGEAGEQPPTDWRSTFGGSAWTRVTEPDGSPGEWYLHLFDVKQPDLNWTRKDVRDEFLDVLRFWFDRGVDGFRIDVAHSLTKDMGYPDLGLEEEGVLDSPDRSNHAHWDRDDVFHIYEEWRELADSYDPARAFVAEAWVYSSERLAHYVAPGVLHTAFNFDFVRAPWSAGPLREVIDTTMASHATVGAPATWVLSNHDITRHVTRYARLEQVAGADIHTGDWEVDVELGRRRGRAAALLMLALPGGAYVYQGDELALEEVTDLPDEVLQDPVWERSGHTLRGRDGCRVPIPWTGSGPSLGFGDGVPWLPQPHHWAELSVAAQEGVEGSTLELYRTALRLRRELDALGDGPMHWIDSAAGVLAFRRDPGFVCVVNIGGAPAELPPHEELLVSSAPLEGGRLPVDAAAWLSTGPGPE
ncbi:MAG TPA: glycoside hydrolase family 13 protein [Jiangellales bacterium]|nr:glycoside hydrolase family 13 protein [Jiangellales bacterium]